MAKKIAMLCILLVGFAVSAGATTTIDFNDAFSINGGSVGNLYSSAGVAFSNALFRDLNILGIGALGDFGIVGAGGETIISFNKDHAIEIVFSVGISSVSITGIDVGANGMQMDAYDSDGNFLENDWFYGSGDGYDYNNNVTTYNTLTIENSSIASLKLYQPTTVNTYTNSNGYTFPEGMVFDNLTFEEIAAVPEPATILLLGSGLVWLAAAGRKKFNRRL